MGNTVACFRPPPSTALKLISYGGATRILTGKHLAGEIMFEFPDSMVCHADSFFIGRPIPSLSIDDELVAGQTYFVLPLDCFTHNVLTASTLAALGSDPDNKRAGAVKFFKDCPFEYVKGPDSRVLIKVVPEFIARLISRSSSSSSNGADDQEPCGDHSCGSFLCSTPELQKHYNQLVGSRDQTWSPKLETIAEYKIRFYSPCRFIRVGVRAEKEIDQS